MVSTAPFQGTTIFLHCPQPQSVLQLPQRQWGGFLVKGELWPALSVILLCDVTVLILFTAACPRIVVLFYRARYIGRRYHHGQTKPMIYVGHLPCQNEAARAVFQVAIHKIRTVSHSNCLI